MMRKGSFSCFLLLFVLSTIATAFHHKSGGISPSSLPAPRQEKRTMCLFTSTKDKEEVQAGDNKQEVVRQTNNPLRLAVLRLGFTELAWTSPLNYGEKNGKFTCAYCGSELFDSDAKYNSGSGWPSFWRSINEGAISYKSNEIKCANCDSHLGHFFLDGPRETEVPQDVLKASPDSDPRTSRPNGRLPRFCVNGACLNLKES